MAEGRSYFSRSYAPAWGILIGAFAGFPIDLATQSHGTLTGVLSMLGLIIGTVIHYEDRVSGKKKLESSGKSRESRLRELQDLRSKSLISEDEYDRKRKEILADL